MNSNYLSGSLITELGRLTPMELWFHRMPLVGTIPSELGNMREVRDLRLSNTELEGTIPEELWNLKSLWRLDIYGANFTGTISEKIGQMADLGVLRISDNNFSGTLPSALNTLPSLERIWLQGNNFSGEISSEICSSRGQGGLYQLFADCLPSVTTGIPTIACECCDVCCDSETEYCDG